MRRLPEWLLWVAAVTVWGGLLGALANYALHANLFAQSRTVALAIGKMGGSETTENHECYFPIGTGAVLMLHPDGEPCKLAREFVNTTGTLLWVKD